MYLETQNVITPPPPPTRRCKNKEQKPSTSAQTHIDVYLCNVCMYIHVFVYMYVSLYIYIYIYIYVRIYSATETQATAGPANSWAQLRPSLWHREDVLKLRGRKSHQKGSMGSCRGFRGL